MPEATVFGQRFRYDVRPGLDGGVPLVLCCGIGASYEVLQPLVDTLDPSLTVCALRRTRCRRITGRPVAGVAWMAVGCARGAYSHSLAYAKERSQFGRPIAGFQVVQDLLVRVLANTTASAALCARLSQLQDAGLAHDEHASLAKAFCTVRMRETVGYAGELLGGNGILLEHNVGRYVADAEAIYSYEGTREMNSLIVGRSITGHSAFV